jgi:hypothetical protein
MTSNEELAYGHYKTKDNLQLDQDSGGADSKCADYILQGHTPIQDVNWDYQHRCHWQCQMISASAFNIHEQRTECSSCTSSLTVTLQEGSEGAYSGLSRYHCMIPESRPSTIGGLTRKFGTFQWFHSLFQFSTDEKSSDFCDPVRRFLQRLALMQNCAQREHVHQEGMRTSLFLDVILWILMKLIWDIKLCSQIMHGLNSTDKCAQRLAQQWNDRWKMSGICYLKLCLMINVELIRMSITGEHYIVVHQLV